MIVVIRFFLAPLHLHIGTTVKPSESSQSTAMEGWIFL